uniref:Uncharacterized protein n=1 Tax=Trepomonas sp. PC1 TaxID=1076344 RepID=A0A146KIP3_9EUKA|eukprot:JAP96580.1 hypothetical protein TPC1_10033 [Trepomonas sp. PC1]
MAEKDQAVNYLKKYSIQDLFDYLQSEIIYNKPENPKQFIAKLLEQLMTKEKEFYSNEEIDILYKKFEILERGFIADKQCEKALTDIGINGDILKKLEIPQQVSHEQFVTLVKQSLNFRIARWHGEE